MTCKCGHSGNDHVFSEGTEVCKVPRCMCMCFNEAIGDNSVIPRHQKYLDQYKTIEQRVKYLLENIPETRDMKNKDFVFLYYHLFHKLNIISNAVIKELVDPESIRRMKQDLVQMYPDKYGPTDENVIYEKHLKENATYQYVMEKYL